MIRALRRSRSARLLAAFGLCAVLSVIVTAELHSGSDDLKCRPALGGDRAGVVWAAAAPVRVDQARHCLVCHAVQSARAEQNGARICPPVAASGVIQGTPPAAVPWLFVSATPARAPPPA